MSSLVSRQLRAPQADGAALIVPPLAEAAALVAANHRAAQCRDVDINGQSLWALAVSARGSLLSAAARHLREGPDERVQWRKSLNDRFNDGPQWLGPMPTQVPADAEYYAPPIIMAGHQPTLFHPGVWIKSFFLSALGQKLDVPVVNLIVDNDLVASPTIAVPNGSRLGSRIQEIPFDAPRDAVPWECRPIADLAMFESFASRVSSVLATTRPALNSRPILDAIWPTAIATAKRWPNRLSLGWSLANCRHQFEQQLGLKTEEAPLSVVCGESGFVLFVEFLLHHLPRLHRIYNEVLSEYRALNRLRGRGRPGPDLASEDEWLEAPLWAINVREHTRRPLFVRRVQGEIELTDRAGPPFRVPYSDGRTANDAWLKLLTFRARIRPRALITTMYARLVLSDLFIHGVGGAKYDELTDEIVRRFFGIEPPRYLTATATFRLPIERPSVTIEDVRNSAHAIRDVRYRPESLIGHPLVAGDAALERELQALAAEKRDYIRTHTLRRGSHDVFAGLDRLNDSMCERLRPLESHLRAEHARLVEQLQQARSLGSREFSFVLYPEEYLVPRLLALASGEK